MKLISLSEKVSIIEVLMGTQYSHMEGLKSIFKHNDFLNTDLLSNYFVEDQEYHYLNRFVPCTIGGFILDKPFNPNDLEPQDNLDNKTALDIIDSWDNYQNRLSKVMFEGFEFEKIDKMHSTVHLKMDSFKYCVFHYNVVNEWFLSMGTNIISDIIKLELTLTPYGAKISGL